MRLLERREGNVVSPASDVPAMHSRRANSPRLRQTFGHDSVIHRTSIACVRDAHSVESLHSTR